ncbi:unnamed protein product [Brachionus calyciflorus]|uniref:Uncharacterized protein n=1 Tax=Brachionus calyciflorus TaxID=104777 RepID=A0A813WFU7_9BILA|nr:unnamed protein product [Brachionus calyciflorus]
MKLRKIIALLVLILLNVECSLIQRRALKKNLSSVVCCDIFEFYFGESCCCKDKKGNLIKSSDLANNEYEYSILTVVNPECVKNKCIYGWKCPYME